MKETSSFQTGQLLADTMDVSPCSSQTQETSRISKKSRNDVKFESVIYAQHINIRDDLNQNQLHIEGF